MHKSIRRSDAALAGAAAMALLALDRAGLFRRLLTICCEDIGIGDETAAILCAAAAEDASWRAKVGGEARVVATLARMMAEAPKDRSADNLVTAAAYHPGLEQYREAAGSVAVADRLRMVEDTNLPLPARAIAAWFGSQCDWHGVRRVGVGDRAGLLETYLRLGASPELVAATGIAVRKVAEPIVLMPALLSAAMTDEPSEIVTCPPPSATMLGSIPAHALDRFTRTGKAAISCFASKNAAVREVLDGLVPDRRWAHLAALAVFHVEGGRLYGKRRLHRDALALERLGQEADYLPERISGDDFARLSEVVERQLPDLNRIRAHHFKDIDQPAQGRLL